MRQTPLAAMMAVLLLWSASAMAQNGDAGPMTVERLDRLVSALDGIEGGIDGQAGAWRFVYRGFQVFVLTDEVADRMRIMVPVAGTDTLGEERLFRLLQANFDTAMDARYAIAQDTLWSVFLHELSSLTDDLFHSGFLQTVTLAATFGTDYSSGAFRFGGGDTEQ